MKQLKASQIVLLITLIFQMTSAIAYSEVVEAQVDQVRYDDLYYQGMHALNNSNGAMLSTQMNLPHSVDEAAELFESQCAFRGYNRKHSHLVEKKYERDLLLLTFHCQSSESEIAPITSTDFTITLNREDLLKDLQVSQLSAKSQADKSDLSCFTAKDGAEIVLAVAASTLASGAMAKQVYAGEYDKFLHATTGSILAATTTLIAYYGLHMSKNQAMIAGIATTIAVALLKEYVYDASHRDIHTVDIRDAEATALGGGIGAFFIRLKFEF